MLPDDAVISTEMGKYIDLVNAADMTPVMCAFVSAVQALIGQENAVRISGLGTFYTKAAPSPSATEQVRGRSSL